VYGDAAVIVTSIAKQQRENFGRKGTSSNVSLIVTISDVVPETKVLVSRRLEDKK